MASKTSAKVSMEFYCPNITVETFSLFFDKIRKGAKGSGIEVRFRARDCSNDSLDDVEENFRGVISSDSFEMCPEYLLDILFKPELMFGSPSIIREVVMSIGLYPPSQLYVGLICYREIEKTKMQNLVEKLNLCENMFVKILDNFGLIPFLKSDFLYRWVSWHIKSANKRVRNMNFWIKEMNNFVANELFPLKNNEEFTKENLEQVNFKNDSIMISFPATCLTYRTASEKHPLHFCFRFFWIVMKEFPSFYYNIDEVATTAFSVLELEAKANLMRKKIGETEKEFHKIVRLASENPNSKILLDIEKNEPILWSLATERLDLVDDVNYITKLVEIRDLRKDLENAIEEADQESDIRFLRELKFAITNTLKSLSSITEITDKKFKEMNSIMGSIKSTLSTQVQMSLEKQNIAIQNTLGVIQLIAIVALSFEVLQYFYSFTYDVEHVSVYLIVLIVPAILVYLVYRKMTSDNQIK